MHKKTVFLACLLYVTSSVFAGIPPGDTLLGRISSLPDNEKIPFLISQLEFVKQKSLSASIEYAKEGLKWANEKEQTKEMAQLNNFIGNTYYQSGNFAQALSFYQNAMKATLKLNKKNDVANLMQKIGIVYFNQTDYKKALVYFEYALKIYQELEYYTHEAEVYNHIGSIYFYWKDYLKAYDNYHRAYSIFNDMQNQPMRLSMQYHKGLSLYKADSIDASLALLEKLVLDYRELYDKNEEAKVLNLLGKIELSKHNLASALAYFNRAYAIQTAINDDVIIAQSLINLGIVNAQMGNFDQALLYFEKSRAIAQKGKYKIILMDVNKALYEYYYLMDEASEALKYYQKYNAYKDSLFYSNTDDKILDNKQQEENRTVLILRKQLLEQQKTTRFLTIAVGGLGLLLMIVIVLLRRKK
jgi:tetratricopeptide (TPR) repeat protein